MPPDFTMMKSQSSNYSQINLNAYVLYYPDLVNLVVVDMLSAKSKSLLIVNKITLSKGLSH